jgi:hypothetical protein
MEIESPKERLPYEWLRYIARVDISKVTDVQSLQFAIDELPECIAYHENWLVSLCDHMPELQVEIHEELATLKRALTCAKVSLDAVTNLCLTKPDVESFTCDTCSKECDVSDGCDDERPNTCDECYASNEGN